MLSFRQDAKRKAAPQIGRLAVGCDRMREGDAYFMLLSLDSSLTVALSS
jgi:hypothetical protein